MGARSLVPLFLSTVTPGKLPDFLIQTGQGIEKGAFPAIGIAYQRNMEVVLFQDWARNGLIKRAKVGGLTCGCLRDTEEMP
jgi:hypothetical protein